MRAMPYAVLFNPRQSQRATSAAPDGKPRAGPRRSFHPGQGENTDIRGPGPQ